MTASSLAFGIPLALPLALCAAFVLCQAVLILFADVSVLDGCKIWQLASFFFSFYFFPLLENRELLGELDGIDVLLQQLSVSNSYASCLPWRYMACFKWEVELEIVGRNKPCDASRTEYVGRFEVTSELHRLPPFLSHLPFLTRYHDVSAVGLPTNPACRPLAFVSPKEACFLLKCIFLGREYRIILSWPTPKIIYFLSFQSASKVHSVHLESRKAQGVPVPVQWDRGHRGLGGRGGGGLGRVPETGIRH